VTAAEAPEGAVVLRHPGVGRVVVGPVEPAATLELRREVLYAGRSPEAVAELYATDPDPFVVAGLTASGEVVATGTVMGWAPPDPLRRALSETAHGPGGDTTLAELPSWRIRGMATRAGARGGGIGAAVLEALVDHVAGHGGGVLWCNARTPALSFYERKGFRRFGDVWADEETGPHVVMWRVVDPVRARAPH
jgi:GNAT superfamily N-acetyltransferase